MLDYYKIITITHQHLNIDELPQFSMPEANENPQLLLDLKEKFGFEELMYLSTCNRVSYILYTDQNLDKQFLSAFFKYINPQMDSEILDVVQKYVRTFEGSEAVKHIFEVASSMDSLVVGEREIFRQYREAYAQCLKIGLVKDNLRLLERYTTTTAKEVYSKTGIGERAISIVSLAVHKFIATEPHKDSRILMIGAGETNTLVGKFLKKHAFTNITIFNRSLDNAKGLSKILSAPSFHLSDLNMHEGGFDVIFICTASNDVIINSNVYSQLLKRDSSKKTLIDLAVPRNIDSDVISQYNTNYIDVESLRSLAESNMQHRKNELVKAKVIVQKNVLDYSKSFQHRQIEKMLTHLPSEIEEVKQRALNSVYKNDLASLDSSTKALIENMMDYMVKKCISVPMKMAKANNS